MGSAGENYVAGVRLSNEAMARERDGPPGRLRVGGDPAHGRRARPRRGRGLLAPVGHLGPGADRAVPAEPARRALELGTAGGAVVLVVLAAPRRGVPRPRPRPRLRGVAAPRPRPAGRRGPLRRRRRGRGPPGVARLRRGRWLPARALVLGPRRLRP